MSETVEYRGMYFDKDTDPNFMKFIVDAYESKKRVVIEYNEGWEDFSGYCGKDGLKHHMHIGKSCGSIKIPCCISSKRSRGGSALITCRKAIKKYYCK